MRHSGPKLIINATRSTVVCERGVIADRPLTRMRGLLGRRALPVGEGLLLTPAPSIHTAFMRFVIDGVLLDSDLRVVKLAAHLMPWRVATARSARSVLELADGEIARVGLRVGDRLSLEDYASPPSEPDSCSRARVLLVATDRRFRTLACATLTRRGYHVTARARTDEIGELAAREYIDVAVTDATGSLTAAAHEAARLQTIWPSIGIVAVSDDPERGLGALPVLPKWGASGSLSAAIEQAHSSRQDRHARR